MQSLQPCLPPPAPKPPLHARLFEETQRGLTRVTSLETVHGSLLALGELLRHTGAGTQHAQRCTASVCACSEPS